MSNSNQTLLIRGLVAGLLLATTTAVARAESSDDSTGRKPQKTFAAVEKPKSLRLGRCAVDDKHVKQFLAANDINDVTEILVLHPRKTFSASNYALFEKAINVEQFNSTDDRMTDNSLAFLAGKKRLRSVRIKSKGITGAFLEFLETTKPTTLDLRYAPIDPQYFDYILKETQLEKLKIRFSDSSNVVPNLTRLRALKSLKYVDIGGSNATHVDLSGLHDLEYVRLVATKKVTDLDLRGCSKLKNVYLYATPALQQDRLRLDQHPVMEKFVAGDHIALDARRIRLLSDAGR